MPLLTSQPYPDANKVLIALLGSIAPTVLRVPTDFQPPLIVVKRVGGQPDAEDITDYPIMLVAVYGADYDAAKDLMDAVEVAILCSPLTAPGGVLVDSAGIHVGEAELPDVYPDDRRLTSTFQLGFRRQPAGLPGMVGSADVGFAIDG